jgi:nucleoside-diphosphate-sugar epimerase
MEQADQPAVALVGGTGAIGRSIATALRAAGRRYRVIGRSRAVLQAAYGDDALAEITTWSADDPVSVRSALRGATTAVHLLGVPYDAFHLHPVLMRRVLDGAIAEGVQRLLLIGTLYPFGRARTARIAEDHPREPHTRKGVLRKQQEDVLMAEDAAGRIRASILRLPDFYGPHVERSLLYDLFAAAKARRRAKLIGPIDRPHEFVFVPDVGPVVARLLQRDDAFGRAWHLGGAGVITQRALATLAYAGPPRLFVAGKNLLRLAGLFDPILRELVDMHYLLTDPLIIDDSALHGLLGSIAKTSYAAGVMQCLAAA